MLFDEKFLPLIFRNVKFLKFNACLFVGSVVYLMISLGLWVYNNIYHLCNIIYHLDVADVNSIAFEVSFASLLLAIIAIVPIFYSVYYKLRRVSCRDVFSTLTYQEQKIVLALYYAPKHVIEIGEGIPIDNLKSKNIIKPYTPNKLFSLSIDSDEWKELSMKNEYILLDSAFDKLKNRVIPLELDMANP